MCEGPHNTQFFAVVDDHPLYPQDDPLLIHMIHPCLVCVTISLPWHARCRPFVPEQIVGSPHVWSPKTHSTRDKSEWSPKTHSTRDESEWSSRTHPRTPPQNTSHNTPPEQTSPNTWMPEQTPKSPKPLSQKREGNGGGEHPLLGGGGGCLSGLRGKGTWGIRH